MTSWVRHLSPVMISKWASWIPAACDSPCIISGIYQLSFFASIERSTSLNDLDKTANLAPPVMVVVVVFYDIMVLVVVVALT